VTRTLAWAALGIIVSIAVITLALLGRGRDAIERSDAARAKGELSTAIVYAKRAAQARLPGSPYPERGTQRLLEIADAAEQAHDNETARAAYRAVLSAARSTDADEQAPAVAEARTKLAKLDGRTADAGPPQIDAPPWSTRVMLGVSALILLAGIALMGRKVRYGWIAFAVGIAGVAIVTFMS